MDPNGAYAQLIKLQEVNQDSDLQTPKDPMSMVVEYQLNEQTESGELKDRVSSDHICGDDSYSESLKSPTAVEIPDTKPKESSALEPPQRHEEVPLSRLAYLNKPELLVILLGVIAAIASGLILPVFGALLGTIINTLYEPPHKLRKDSNFWSLMFLILAFATIVSFPARTYLFAIAGSKLIKRIRLMSFDKAVHMEVGWFDKPENSSAAVGARLSSDAATVRSLVGDALALLVQNVSTLIAGLVISFVACWQLALIILLMIPVMGLSGWIQMKFTKGFNLHAKEKYAKASQVASDAVGSIRTVASFTAEDKVMELYKKKCKGLVATSIQNGLVSGIGFGLSFLILYSVYATSFYAGARLVQDGKTTFADVFRVFFSLSFAAVGISQYSNLGPDAKKAKSATASVFSILDRTSSIDSSDKSGINLETVIGNIEFQYVSFKYPTRPDVQIFQDLCLAIQSGKTVALVGESGSGKSTVVSLLQRFYDPDSGHILLDGVEIQKLNLRWLRQQMGLVSQEPALFNDTIRANIAYGKGGDATEAEILAAAELANAHQFISGLQQGYDASVGERGIQLSGGQKQRVAIARAIIKDPKIMLLDEATSALDSESERVVQEALDRVMLSRTTIVIAHRLSTVRNADLIGVIRNGRIIEQGNHDELINVKDGAYASLVALS